MYMGVELAQQKGKSWIPQPSLALTKLLRRESFNQVSLSKEEALCYLRGEALALQEVPIGYVLLLFNNLPLGWVKHLGNRSNNLYPNEWRIRYL